MNSKMVGSLATPMGLSTLPAGTTMLAIANPVIREEKSSLNDNNFVNLNTTLDDSSPCLNNDGILNVDGEMITVENLL